MYLTKPGPVKWQCVLVATGSRCASTFIDQTARANTFCDIENWRKIIPAKSTKNLLEFNQNWTLKYTSGHSSNTQSVRKGNESIDCCISPVVSSATQPSISIPIPIRTFTLETNNFRPAIWHRRDSEKESTTILINICVLIRGVSTLLFLFDICCRGFWGFRRSRRHFCPCLC